MTATSPAQTNPTSDAQPWQIGFGDIRHRRLRPAKNAFAYGGYFLRLRMDNIASVAQSNLPRWFSYNRWNILSFNDADHGQGDGNSIAWVRSILSQGQINDADGAIWLHTFARVLGYSFKPVSFWFCHRADGQLRAVIAEVNNTFGERHCYLLDNADGQPINPGQLLVAQKTFHVSPFCHVRGIYQFRFLFRAASDNSPAQWVARIDHSDAQGLLLQTSQSGALHPLDDQSVKRAITGYPLFSFAVIARIHWQAIKLWVAKKLPYVSKPLPPDHGLTRSTAQPQTRL